MNGGNQTDQTDHEKKKRVFGRIDFLGIITFTVGFVCLMLAVLWGGGRYEWKTPQVIGLYCGFVVLFPLYVYIDLYVAPEPMIPILRLIRLRNYVLSFIINIMAGGCLYGITLFYPIYFQVVIGDHAFDAGMRLLPFMLAVCVAAAVSGWIVSKYGEYRVQIWIGLALATTGTGLTLIWTTESPPYLFTLAPIISGTGYGMVFLTTFTSAQSQLTINQDSDTPENEKNSDGGRSSGSGVYVDDLAAGTALIDFCRTIGGVLSTSILTSALNNSAIALIGDRPDHDQLISAIRKGIGAIIDDLEWGQQLAVLDAYVYGSFMVRLVLTAASGLAFILSLGMKNVPLKDHKK
ncbi:MFS general substrate transporter [Ramicandelaber brevisporus]|nr:MFS general substrate transporter [Ramicandelaber brevisporus]